MRRRISRLLRQHWHLLGAVALLGYFGWHGVHGERGLQAWAQKADELQAARADLVRARRELGDMGARVAALQPDRADPDLLEEQLRALGYIAKDEVIVLPDPAR